MTSGHGWSLSFPDICLTVEETPRKRLNQENWPDQGLNLGQLGERQRFYPMNTAVVLVLLLLLGFTTLFNISGHQCRSQHRALTSDKFCSEALISAWGSFTCRKSTTQDPRLYFPSEGSHTQDFYALKKSIDPGRIWTHEPQIQWKI